MSDRIVFEMNLNILFNICTSKNIFVYCIITLKKYNDFTL